MEINPLNILNVRKVKFCVEHFYYIHLLSVSRGKISKIDEWIYNNLRSRYYINECIVLENNQLIAKLKIGFENEKESTLFLLSCPYINS